MAEHTLGSGPVEERYREVINGLAKGINDVLNGDTPPNKRENGFILLLFPFGHKGRCNYISNALREDVIVLLKEQLRYFEGQADNLEGHA